MFLKVCHNKVKFFIFPHIFTLSYFDIYFFIISFWKMFSRTFFKTMLSVENFQKVCKYDPGWVEERRCNLGVLLKRIPPIIQRLFKIWWEWRHEKKIPMHFVFVYFLYFILFDMIKLVSSFVYTLVQVSDGAHGPLIMID